MIVLYYKAWARCFNPASLTLFGRLWKNLFNSSDIFWNFFGLWNFWAFLKILFVLLTFWEWVSNQVFTYTWLTNHYLILNRYKASAEVCLYAFRIQNFWLSELLVAKVFVSSWLTRRIPCCSLTRIKNYSHRSRISYDKWYVNRNFSMSISFSLNFEKLELT